MSYEDDIPHHRSPTTNYHERAIAAETRIDIARAILEDTLDLITVPEIFTNIRNVINILTPK